MMAGRLSQETWIMTYSVRAIVATAVLVAVGGSSSAWAQKSPGPEKYTVSVPGGLSFAEFKGYESWEVIAISHSEHLLAATLGNAAMINAYKAGYPGNGKPFPEGARMAKIHWVPKKHQIFQTTAIPGMLHDVDFMVKDSKRFKDSGGWGYAAFKFDSAAGMYRPQSTADAPPQGNNATCGFACHTIVKDKDYVFTEYGPR
jgi:hypothetical protein